ncbi:MAG TPA: transketolase [Armatimonadota bacterium]|nr:transketolase [Armatimonadota bacterium]
MSLQKDQLHNLGQQIRIDSIRSTTAAGSGHPTSSLSGADLMAVLMANYLHYRFDCPEDPANDHLIFSKGHASPLLYAMYRAAGAISDDEMMTLRKFGSRLQGHPTPVIPWVDVATGSLGQGLPIGVGVALAGKYLDKLPYRVWVLLGDSEMAEGSIWEAFDHASHYRLNNMIGILDMNRLGQRGETDLGWNGAAYAARARAFGWNAVEIDGHNLDQIDRAYREALEPRDQPTLIVARTIKGRGVSFIENKDGWHGKALDEEQAKQAIDELRAAGAPTEPMIIQVQPPEEQRPHSIEPARPLSLPKYEMGQKTATRKAYGAALAALGASRPDVVALDGEVSNSTFAVDFAKAFPERFFEMYIAEQQMVAAAVGMGVRRRVAFASTFAAFLSRAYDFIRMAAVSQANIRLCGSHAGCSIGADGPSQMALEDLAMMRAVEGSTVLYPCDANQTARLVVEMAERPGISYLRTTREDLPVLYSPEEEFPIGGCKVVRQSSMDQATVIGAGVTLHEAMKAADELQKERIAVRVIDLYSVKPVDRQTLLAAARDTDGRLVVVEDHWPEGGIGSAVLEALASVTEANEDKVREVPGRIRMVHLAVKAMPGSGEPEELMDAAGITAKHIATAVKALLGKG